MFASAPGQQAPSGKRSLTLLGRPAPALAETRGPARRTGAELREIFPALFEETG